MNRTQETHGDARQELDRFLDQAKKIVAVPKREADAVDAVRQKQTSQKVESKPKQ